MLVLRSWCAGFWGLPVGISVACRTALNFKEICYSVCVCVHVCEYLQGSSFAYS